MRKRLEELRKKRKLEDFISENRIDELLEKKPAVEEELRPKLRYPFVVYSAMPLIGLMLISALILIILNLLSQNFRMIHCSVWLGLLSLRGEGNTIIGSLTSSTYQDNVKYSDENVSKR